MDENYYPLLFLEECKNVVKENKTNKFINKELEIPSDESIILMNLMKTMGKDLIMNQ